MSTVNFELRVVTNFKPLEVKIEKIKKKIEGRQAQFDLMVLKDSNEYSPEWTGNMMDSGFKYTNFGEGEIEWRTHYVREQYYNPLTCIGGRCWPKKKDINPKATYKWFEFAKVQYKDKWINFVKKGIE